MAADRSLVFLALNNLGQAFHTMRRSRRALRLFELALVVNKTRSVRDVANDVTLTINMSAVAWAAGAPERAEALLEEAIGTSERHWSDGHFLTAAATNNLAKMFESTERLDEAETLFARAARMLSRTLGPEHPQTEQVFDNWRMTRVRSQRPRDSG